MKRQRLTGRSVTMNYLAFRFGLKKQLSRKAQFSAHSAFQPSPMVALCIELRFGLKEWDSEETEMKCVCFVWIFGQSQKHGGLCIKKIQLQQFENRMWKEPKADQQHAGGITSPICFESTSESSRKTRCSGRDHERMVWVSLPSLPGESDVEADKWVSSYWNCFDLRNSLIKKIKFLLKAWPYKHFTLKHSNFMV